MMIVFNLVEDRNNDNVEQQRQMIWNLGIKQGTDPNQGRGSSLAYKIHQNGQDSILTTTQGQPAYLHCNDQTLLPLKEKSENLKLCFLTLS